MSDKKNLDAFFREKLQPKDTYPPEEIWEQIDQRLHGKPRRKRLFPLWFALGGAAAILLVMITLETEKDFKELEVPVVTDRPAQIRPGEKGISREDNSYSGTANTNSAQSGKLSEPVPTNIAYETTVPQHEQQDILRPEVGVLDKPAESSVVPYGSRITTEEIKGGPLALDSPSSSETNIEHEPMAVSEERNKILISPVVAVLYYDNLGKGHALDTRFAQNSSTGTLTTSYGVSVGYSLFKNMRLKTGLHNVRLEAVTRQVGNAAAFNATAIDADPAYTLSSPEGKGELKQSLEYLEVPLEIEYALLHGRLSVNMESGASAYFLQENQVHLESRGYTTFLGAANNLRRTSFSLNLGLGLDYTVAEKLHFNLGPSFKYHLSTFETETGVKPFHIGLFTGFSFGF